MGRVLAQTESAMSDNEEFELTEKDFKFIQWFMHKNVGIFFSDRKRTMVYGRVSRQLRRLGLKRFCEYRQVIEQDPREQVSFINCLTTNKTQFFREYHHFEFIEKVLMKEWRQQGVKRLRVWSAGCSTGEEPYSLISSLHWANALSQFEDVSLTATDLDTKVLAHAKEGIYSDEAIATIPKKYLKPCFVRGVGQYQGSLKCKVGLQKRIKFHRLNLLEKWNFEDKFDLISCRNVMIYFDRQTQEKLIKRFHQQLKPNGVLFLGHSEGVPASLGIFHHLGHTIYVKK
ncbi:protein-glutamate O-methyltransferase CheR [Vibrio europaeus]|uniref:CheR family methyltransferase n=1 Tax=Vibrio europaeus TaxID=300876 RepID=UPI00234005D7|nr:protein-glutamate O-methyltransferase CheR [Vibrio europaeus]MDC5849735.1 protein-glutamate O-methyltransferase CheR [Vibrio europaeus]